MKGKPRDGIRSLFSIKNDVEGSVEDFEDRISTDEITNNVVEFSEKSGRKLKFHVFQFKFVQFDEKFF